MNVRAIYDKSATVKWTFAALFLAAALCVFWSAPAHADDDDDDDGDAVPGEIVIKFNADVPGTNNQKIQAVYQDYPEVDPSRTETLLNSSGIYLLRLNDPAATEAVIERMEADTATAQDGRQVPRFRYVEPNFTTDVPEGNPRHRARAGGEPIPSTDPAPYSNQYAINMLGLSCAHQTNEGAGTTVAVLDTGVQSDHPELSGSLVPGYDFIGDNGNPDDAGNGVDDDGDGEIDEMVGHGTHVAGIVHLSAPEAEIMPMKVLDSDGTGNVFVIAEAVQRAIDNGADVVNMSLGSSGESELLADIVEDLAREVEDDDDDDGDDADDDVPAISGVPPAGVAVVASAGNENVSTEHYPAAHGEAVAVASVGEGEVKSEFSNFGTWVDVAAPGEEIHSLFPASQYASWDGTSMAAPFVAGQAAILRSMRPNMPTLVEEDDDVANPPPSVVGVIRDTASSLDATNPSHAGMLGSGLANVGASVARLDSNASCGGGQSEQTNTAPVTADVSPGPGAKIKTRTPLISATVTDDGRLAKSNISLFVDGAKKTTFAYDAATGKLSYKSSRLAPKAHTVKIVARDSQGLASTETWRFTIKRR
jgi:thermitase